MSTLLLKTLDQEARELMRERNLVVDEMKPSDREFALEAFRAWKLDCHDFQGDKAWRVMADFACSPAGHLETVAVRGGERVVALLIVVPHPGEFWPIFLSRLGPVALLSKLADAVVQAIRKTFSGGRRNQHLTETEAETEIENDELVDEEFARLTQQSHQTTEGVAWGLISYVDPEYRKPPTAFLMYRRMFQQLRSKGFKRLEGQIRFGNDDSVSFHRGLGFEIRNAGSCFHAVKHLSAQGMR